MYCKKFDTPKKTTGKEEREEKEKDEEKEKGKIHHYNQILAVADQFTVPDAIRCRRVNELTFQLFYVFYSRLFEDLHDSF